MIKFWSLFFWVFLFFSLQNPLFAQLNRIQLNGESYYINGINIPWNYFGWDFGVHPLWGRGYDADWFENAFTELEASGVNTARIWVHCDGRANPEFDENGFVTGLDAPFLDDLDDMISRANDHHIMLILCLWSHDMLEDDTDFAGRHAGLHSDLISDPEKTQSYIEHALIPMVQSLNEHCNILAWEIMNEPEWGMNIDDGNSTTQTVSVEEMQGFMGRCIQSIREHSDQNITIGSAIPFGNRVGQNRNFWKESDFHQLGFDCSQVYLDFYSFHYYDWMPNSDSPFENDADSWELGKPILIAETATMSSELPDGLSPMEQLKKSAEQNYAGTLLWSYNARDAYSDWQNAYLDMSAFGDTQANITYTGFCDSVYIDQPILLCKPYPNPARSYVNFPVHFPNLSFSLEIELINLQGQLVQKSVLPYESTDLDVGHLSAGFYYVYLKVMDDQGQLIQSGSSQLVIL